MYFWKYVQKLLKRVIVKIFAALSIVFELSRAIMDPGKSCLSSLFDSHFWCWDNHSDTDNESESTFSLPSPLPQWPPGEGFGSGRISLGEIEVSQISEFERIWSCGSSRKQKGVTFYRPAEIPDGFFCLGHYCQPNDEPLREYILVARDTMTERNDDLGLLMEQAPALKKPDNYTLIWSDDSGDGHGYIWLPNSPAGYRAMGFLVTDNPEEPDPEEIRCVREDLTETCETCHLLLTLNAFKNDFQLWKTRPCKRGMMGTGVSVGTFFGRTNVSSEEKLTVACLKNNDPGLRAMPNIEQIHALIQHYGPTVFFHPDEDYLPSSVDWFFKNGALLYRKDKKVGEPIDCNGVKLPSGGTNDGEYWIDLPCDEEARNHVKKGNLESAELYVHVKPAIGGTYTDLAMWVFCPFNGPSSLKVGFLSLEMKKIGEHVGDWEHFTLRISNFTGKLWSVYFSQHSGGKWIDAYDLEFIEGNKPIVYSSKSGHASFPHPGTYLQGSSKLNIGVKNEAAKSKLFIDSSSKYRIIAAEYLGTGFVEEPCWLQFMREWGPTIVYDSMSELDKLIDLLPKFVRFSVEDFIGLFPTELYCEEGPTGPKEKDNWFGDERW